MENFQKITLNDFNFFLFAVEIGGVDFCFGNFALKKTIWRENTVRLFVELQVLLEELFRFM